MMVINISQMIRNLDEKGHREDVRWMLCLLSKFKSDVLSLCELANWLCHRATLLIINILLFKNFSYLFIKTLKIINFVDQKILIKFLAYCDYASSQLVMTECVYTLDLPFWLVNQLTLFWFNRKNWVIFYQSIFELIEFIFWVLELLFQSLYQE